MATIADTFNSGANVISAGSNLLSAGSNLISGAMSANDVGSFIRSSAIPAAAEAVGDFVTSLASFTDAGNDWRVRLSLPKWTSFASSPVLKPLQAAGGMIFPYTPSITIKQSAKYSAMTPMHSNYGFHAFQSSDPGTISITAPMNVEDSEQAMYWIAGLHYFRAMTKMFSGYDAKAGNPPPIVFLNGYGNYVFKNIPVVVTSFDVQLGNDCDYISCDVKGSLIGDLTSDLGALGNLAGAVGQSISGLSSITNTISQLAGDATNIASLIGGLGIGGTVSAGTTHVPTKSSFTITLQPMYSRESVKNFSLDTFVTGGYLNGTFGYI